MEAVYYTCLNNKCPKHRNVFLQDDPEHADCACERLYLEGQSRAPAWLWFALPAALGLAVVAAFLFVTRTQRPQPLLPPENETWSGAERTNTEREGHAVPPPMT